MAGSLDSNSNDQRTKKSGQKSGKQLERQEHSGKTGQRNEGSGKSGRVHHHHHDKSGKSKKKHKRVRFEEEHTSKRQRVEDDDDLTTYKDEPLEAISSKFENTKPYFTNGMFVDLKKFEELGFEHLKGHLEKYMCWLGVNNEYNINVLRVFCQSLTAETKYKKVNGKEHIRRVTFTATVRGRTFRFTWRDINRLLGVAEEELNEWLYPEKLSQAELEKVYDTKGKKVSGMSDSNRVLHYIYSRMMTVTPRFFLIYISDLINLYHNYVIGNQKI